GGVHTPNHRWDVAAALAQVNELYPKAEYISRIEEWLAEGIDQDQDGFFSERSPSYDAKVTAPALLHLALLLPRPQLLDHVRRNLRLLPYLVEPNGEVETVASRRQDQRQMNHVWIRDFYIPLRYLAVVDGDEVFTALAQW